MTNYEAPHDDGGGEMTDQQKFFLMESAFRIAGSVVAKDPDVLTVFYPELAGVSVDDVQLWLRYWIMDVRYAREYDDDDDDQVHLELVDPETRRARFAPRPEPAA
jgi:hypothetical protein